MGFSNEAIEFLRKMGWKEGRKISLEELKLPYSDYPQHVINFLQEYGNLSGLCKKQDYTDVINEIFIIPETEKQFLEGDKCIPYYQEVIRRKMYPIGAYNGDD